MASTSKLNIEINIMVLKEVDDRLRKEINNSNSDYPNYNNFSFYIFRPKISLSNLWKIRKIKWSKEEIKKS